MAQTIYFGYEETLFYNPMVSETSAATAATSAQIVPLIVAAHPGTVVDCYVALAQTAVSASGFVSGTANANVRINSATCLSTQPSISMASASASNNRARSNNSGTGSPNVVYTSAVVNTASATFAKGDQISIDYGVISAGSAAAGMAAAGISVGVVLRYNAV